MEIGCIRCGIKNVHFLYFVPCAHKACRPCVQEIRVANVYKPDKGVKCPRCRTVIQEYVDSLLKVHTLVKEEEQWVDTPYFQEPEQTVYNRKGITSIGHKNDYTPPKLIYGAVKLHTREDELSAGYIIPPLKPDSDLLAMAMDKTGARHLDHMLRPSYDKRHKVAKLAREMLTPFVAKLSMNGNANYALQRMMEYAAENRKETGTAECFFTSMVRSLCRDNGLVLAAQDARGTYSVQKMLVLFEGSEELRLILKAITGSVVMLSLHKAGVYAMQRLIQALVTSLNGSLKRPRVPPREAVKALIWLATELSGNKKVIDVGMHSICGLVFVEVIRWSLPDEQSFQAAMAMVAHSKALSTSRHGRKTLQGLLSLEVRAIAESIITALENEYAVQGMDTRNGGMTLVSSCLATRCVSEEYRLRIVNELLASCDNPSTQAKLFEEIHGCDVLVFGLACLSRSTLNDRYGMIKGHVSCQRFEMLEQLVESMRASLSVDPISPTTGESAESGLPEALSNPRSASSSPPVIDPWDDEPTANARSGLRGARSEGSISEISAEAADWEQLAAWDDTDTRSRSYSPPNIDVSPGVTSTAPKNDWHPLLKLGPELISRRPPSPNIGVIGRQRSVAQVQHPSQHMSCIVCNTEDADVVILDCSHLCVCVTCAGQVSKCPACGAWVRDVLQVKSFTRPSTPQSNRLVSEHLEHNLPIDPFQTLSLSSPGVGPPVPSQVEYPYRMDVGESPRNQTYQSKRNVSTVHNKPIVVPPRPYRPPGMYKK